VATFFGALAVNSNPSGDWERSPKVEDRPKLKGSWESIVFCGTSRGCACAHLRAGASSGTRFRVLVCGQLRYTLHVVKPPPSPANLKKLKVKPVIVEPEEYVQFRGLWSITSAGDRRLRVVRIYNHLCFCHLKTTGPS